MDAETDAGSGVVARVHTMRDGFFFLPHQLRFMLLWLLLLRFELQLPRVNMHHLLLLLLFDMLILSPEFDGSWNVERNRSGNGSWRNRLPSDDAGRQWWLLCLHARTACRVVAPEPDVNGEGSCIRLCFDEYVAVAVVAVVVADTATVNANIRVNISIHVNNIGVDVNVCIDMTNTKQVNVVIDIIINSPAFAVEHVWIHDLALIHALALGCFFALVHVFIHASGLVLDLCNSPAAVIGIRCIRRSRRLVRSESDLFC